jgi:hypothetical protein
LCSSNTPAVTRISVNKYRTVVEKVVFINLLESPFNFIFGHEYVMNLNHKISVLLLEIQVTAGVFDEHKYSEL